MNILTVLGALIYSSLIGTYTILDFKNIVDYEAIVTLTNFSHMKIVIFG